MAVTLSTNISSLKAQRRLSTTDSALRTSFERLSSGLRVNRASDDAAGLAIASLLSVDNRVFSQAVRNINDGISSMAIAEGTLQELSNITIRQKELAEQAANGTLSLTQRRSLHLEANALVEEYNRIVQTTRFNGRQLLTPDSTDPTISIQAGYGASAEISMTVAGQLAFNSGLGTVASSANYGTGGSQPRDTVIADFNSDGNLDLATSNRFGNGLGIALGNGDGTFLAPSAQASGTEPWAITTGDFNGDGILDLATADYNDAARGLSVFIGVGNGTFQARISFVVGGTFTSDLTAADFNGDGRSDLAVSTSTGVSVFISDGNGSFGGAQSLSVTGSSGGVTTGDFNGDGRVDIAAATGSSGGLEVFLGNGNGSFRARTLFSTGGSAFRVERADFNHDGYADLLVAEYAGFSASLFLGNGDGSFKARTSYVESANVDAIAIGDLNGDGFSDFTSSSGGRIFFRMGNGDGTFKVSTSASTVSSTLGMSIADLDGDGSAEIIAAQGTANTTSVLFQNTTRSSAAARLNLLTTEDAKQTLTKLTTQLKRISLELGSIGAFQSRLDTAVTNLVTARVNIGEAVSRLTDVDVAEESSRLVRLQILQQAASAVMVQANAQQNIALDLLQFIQ